MMVDSYRLLSAFYEKQFLAFRNRRSRKRLKTEFMKRACRGRKLSLSAVDQHEVWQRPRLTQQSRIPPANHFIHRLEVIGLSLNRSDLKFSVVGFLHRAVLTDNHRCNILGALNIRYVK